MRWNLIGRGVSACATCDGFFYRDKVVHVVGGKTLQWKKLTFLPSLPPKVYIIHRRDTLRASKPMQQKDLLIIQN